MLSLDGQVKSLFAERSLHGRLHLGVSEDFVMSRLPAVLEDFIFAASFTTFTSAVSRRLQRIRSSP
jgi:hypothetical protein